MKPNYFIVGLILLTHFFRDIFSDHIIKSFDLSLTLVALLPFSFFIAYGSCQSHRAYLTNSIKRKRS